MRSRLHPYREAIAEALDAGTSVRALARTYGCHHSTMAEFVGRRSTTGTERSRASRASDPLRETQYNTRRDQRRQVERSRQRVEEAYL
jgi:transposase-like protein